jgi:hypothetical protein
MLGRADWMEAPADTAEIVTAELTSTGANYRRNHSGWSAGTSEFRFTLARRLKGLRKFDARPDRGCSGVAV